MNLLLVLLALAALCLSVSLVQAQGEERVVSNGDSAPESEQPKPFASANADSAGKSPKGAVQSEDEDAELSPEQRRVLREKQREARKNKILKNRKKMGSAAVHNVLRSSQSDSCDWKLHPLAILKGELCGSRYKVLGLDRRKQAIDKLSVKKAYRQTSLAVHPDKNPSEDAEAAFKVVQEAYDCLWDDECRQSYDQELGVKEQTILWKRHELKAAVMRKIVAAINYAHYHVSVAAHYVFQTGVDLWNWAGDWEVAFLGEEWPFGRPLLLAVLLWRGQLLLKVHALAYLIERANYELAKYRGIL